MCVNNLFKVTLDCAAAGIEPAISSRKSNALTTTPPSHTSLNSQAIPATTQNSVQQYMQHVDFPAVSACGSK